MKTLKTEYEYIIIGAGPAGLQLGYYLERAGRDYLILEAADAPGEFFRKYPRHRKLLSINKLYTGYDDAELNLRWDWNSLLCDDKDFSFRNYSKEYFPDASDLVSYLQDFARKYELNIACNREVKRVKRDENFILETNQGETLQCSKLIVASGIQKHRIPSIKGIEHSVPYSEVSVNPEDFINKKVLIIGKGNSSFETAENLIGTTASIHIVSPEPLQMSWQTHFVGHLRAVNNNFLDTYQLKSQNAVLNAEIEEIKSGEDGIEVSVKYIRAEEEREKLKYDIVINCTGFQFDASIFDENCKPQLIIANGSFPEQTSEFESVNIKDLYFAGALNQARDYKKTTSAFIHGFRYNAKALFFILESRYQNQAWPGESIAGDVETILRRILERINTSSALWQQFGFLGDLLVREEDGRATYYEEMPVDLIHEKGPGRDREYFVITLEYGSEKSADPFSAGRIAKHNTQAAQESKFLHPIVRYYKGGELQSQHHVIEDLAAEWLEPEHVDPLRDYLEQSISLVNARA